MISSSIFKWLSRFRGLLLVVLVLFCLLSMSAHMFFNRRHSVVSDGGVFELLVRDGLDPLTVSAAGCSPVERRSGGGRGGDSSGYVVPNVVHYVWLSDDLTFSFTNYLSFLSVDRFLGPDFVFVFGEALPAGVWWRRVVAEVPCLYHVRVDRPRISPNGKPFKFLAHSSDFLRFNLLLKYGGIYLDADVLVVKSFDRLRRYDMVMGREQPNALCNGIMLARRGAQFLRFVLELYGSYLGEAEEWGARANRMPHALALRYPQLIHVEETSLDRPNWKESRSIYGGLYNWTSNYAVHLWVRKWPDRFRPQGTDDIKAVNTTLGEISRLILYGAIHPRQ